MAVAVQRGRCARGPRRRLWLRRAARPSLLALGLMLALSAEAGDWDVQPDIRISQTWTDNIDLVAEDPEEEWITEVAPGIRLTGEGRRSSAVLGYRLLRLFHVNDSDRDRVNHRVAGQGSVEVARERLFLDADVTRRERLSGPDAGVADTVVFRDDERETVTTLGGGPRVQHDLSRFARFDAAYRRERIDFGGDERDVSDIDRYTAGLSSGPQFSRWGWALAYSRRDESRDQAGRDLQEIRFEDVRGEINLRAGPATQLFAAGGYEDNEFTTAAGRETFDGSFWETGARWRPRRNVAVEAAVGERFFGETARASVTARGPALRVDLDYAEDLVTTPGLEFERTTVLFRDADGNIILDPDGTPVSGVVDVPTLRDDVMRQRRLSTRLGWERAHSDVALRLMTTEREFLLEGLTEDRQQADLDWRWTRLPRTTIRSGIGTSRQEFARSDRVDDVHTLRWRASRDLGRDADVALDLRHVRRDSNVDAADFRSNRVTLTLQKRF